ncbi:MAG: SpoVG family protein [Clostridiales Family XIII bacterium]|nr:SpoVG family protein [Clostridiales Family XIII bacterium]
MGIDVRVNKMVYRDDTNTKAYVSAAIDGKFAIHNIKIVGGPKGDFVSMPQVNVNGRFHDIFHPISADAREELNSAVMKAYEQKVREAQEQSASSEDTQFGSFGTEGEDASSGGAEDESESDDLSEENDVALSM